MSVWGVGFDLAILNAGEDILGTGWTIVPIRLPRTKVDARCTVATDRADVNSTNIQYFWCYNLNSTTFIGAGPAIVANWKQDSGNTRTVPVGKGISKTINVGKVPVRCGLEASYSGIHPDDIVGCKWNFRFSIIPAVPAVLFKWMQ